MSDDKIDQKLELEGHNYDGITELDNPLPAWWMWTFLLTIIFAFLYYIHYEVTGSGPTLKQELTASLEELKKNQQHETAVFETEDTLKEALNKPELVGLGGMVFADKCAVCHGTELQGQIGPNLTDKFWIHGRGTRMDIVKSIREGVADKGMPAWKQLLSTEDVYAVTAFIIYKKDSHPANAKAPQGEPVEN